MKRIAPDGIGLPSTAHGFWKDPPGSGMLEESTHRRGTAFRWRSMVSEILREPTDSVKIDWQPQLARRIALWLAVVENGSALPFPNTPPK
ncbi:MAG TPA: hypothetical protein DIS93_03055 [Bdellovibrionales bacterium]|nr:hypothetical protein [Bdellovibrionales bacterium]